MTRISDTNLPAEFQSALLALAEEGAPILLHHEEKELGVLVSMRDYQLLQRIEDYLDGEEVKRSKAEPGEPIDWNDLAQELGL